ncbi:hypothetical protein CEXT_539511 [Caerostris extrusa]|uniref:Uncharacterized protein n=1 Tax=Caerostris extrusa TaxID=172846 RepID=A0AAV4RLC3_CAEEX|nr:hypothetical protein CEXT_539511 [Caerostris extrusa]
MAQLFIPGQTLRDSPLKIELFYFGERFKPKKDEYPSERFRVFKRRSNSSQGGTIHLHPFPTHLGLGTPHQERNGTSISIWPHTFISNTIYFVPLGLKRHNYPFLDKILRDFFPPKNRELFYFGERFKPKKDEYSSERFRVFKRTSNSSPGETIHFHPCPPHWGLELFYFGERFKPKKDEYPSEWFRFLSAVQFRSPGDFFNPKNRELFYFGERFKPKKDEYPFERIRVFKRRRIRPPGETIPSPPLPHPLGSRYTPTKRETGQLFQFGPIPSYRIPFILCL